MFSVYRRCCASFICIICSFAQHVQRDASQTLKSTDMITRHRASTSMYSTTFCVRFLLPERHQWKPAFQTAVVMLRTPPSPAGRPRPLAVCGARFWGRPPSPAGRRPAPATSVAGRRRAQTPPSRPFALCRHIAGCTQAWN